MMALQETRTSSTCKKQDLGVLDHEHVFPYDWRGHVVRQERRGKGVIKTQLKAELSHVSVEPGALKRGGVTRRDNPARELTRSQTGCLSDTSKKILFTANCVLQTCRKVMVRLSPLAKDFPIAKHQAPRRKPKVATLTMPASRRRVKPAAVTSAKRRWQTVGSVGRLVSLGLLRKGS